MRKFFVCLFVIGSFFCANIVAKGESLNGSFHPFDDESPSFGSSSSENDDHAYGSFWLNLDANTASLSSANWSFYANSQDTSYWTATCYLYGLRNSYTESPQDKSWSQSYSGDNGINILGCTNLNCYDTHGDQINNLLGQIADLKKKLTNANPEDAPSIRLLLQLVQKQLSLVEDNNKKVLAINGSFNILPSILEGSSFNYTDTIDDLYSWPNGYDHDPVITKKPSWKAQFNVYGRFITPTIEEARAMGLKFSQTVPEPSTFIMVLVAGFATICSIGWQKHKS